MKRFFFILAVAVTAITACTKSELTSEPLNNEISFQAANYVTSTKVSGAEFPKTDVFGTFAWTAGTATTYFIDNQRVSYNETKDVWTTATPYYWPKNQSVDFFSYYPYNGNGSVPTVVSATQIKYNAIDFTDNQTDFMYADKAVGYTDNANSVEDGVSARGGVPTFFRHAGAKVHINVILGENEKVETVTGTKTKWEVILKEVVLSGIYTKGDCVLNLASTPTEGIVPWVKPVNNATDNYYVWTPDVNVTNDVTNSLYKDNQQRTLVKGEGQEVIPMFYALPQVLVANQQKISLKLIIKAYRTVPGDATYPEYPAEPYLTQAGTDGTGKVFTADLRIANDDPTTSILAWQMNQAITYNITLGPAGQQITFDPAVDAWESKTAQSSIDISLDL